MIIDSSIVSGLTGAISGLLGAIIGAGAVLWGQHAERHFQARQLADSFLREEALTVIRLLRNHTLFVSNALSSYGQETFQYAQKAINEGSLLEATLRVDVYFSEMTDKFAALNSQDTQLRDIISQLCSHHDITAMQDDDRRAALEKYLIACTPVLEGMVRIAKRYSPKK